MTGSDSLNPVAVLFQEVQATTVKLHTVDFTVEAWTTFIEKAHADLTAIPMYSDR